MLAIFCRLTADVAAGDLRCNAATAGDGISRDDDRYERATSYE